MAKKILIGTVVVGATRYYAGTLLDESAEAETVAAVVAAGGQLLDEGDPVVDAAASVARQKLRDGHWQGVDGVMLAALAKSAYAPAQGGALPFTAEKDVAATTALVAVSQRTLARSEAGGTVAKVYISFSDAVTADDVDFAAYTFYVLDAAGGLVSELANLTTQTVLGGGIGDAAAFAVYFATLNSPAQRVVLAGGSVVYLGAKVGVSGRALPDHVLGVVFA